MYASSSISRFVRYIPSLNIVFYCSKSGSGFNKNGHEPQKRTNLEQDDQNNIAKDENGEQNNQNGLKGEEQPIDKAISDSNFSPGFKDCSGFNKKRNGFSGSKETLVFAKGVDLNELAVYKGFQESLEDSPKLGFDGGEGVEDKSWFEENADGYEGLGLKFIKENLGFQENVSEFQGSTGDLGFHGSLNGSQRLKDKFGFQNNSNGFQGLDESSNVSQVFDENLNRSQGFEENLKVFQGFEQNSNGFHEFVQNLNGSQGFEENSNRSQRFKEDIGSFSWFKENPKFFSDEQGEKGEASEESNGIGSDGSSSSRVYGKFDYEAKLLYEILQREEPGFDVKEALQQTGLRMTVPLVRRVLKKISCSCKSLTKSRSAKLGFKFFLWAGQQDGYKHSPETYNLLVKIFADCEELKAMWRLVDEMMVSGCPVTARTFNILLCRSRQAGMARKVVEMFIQSKNFNYRPYKHSFNAILHALLKEKHVSLIEWVYEEMLNYGHSADMLTYNIMIYAKYRLGKLDEFNQLLQDMGKNGFAPDLHTYNILLHVLGKGDKPLAASKLLDYMMEVGCHPQVTHFTSLIDGLGRAGNLDACKYFFEDMGKMGCKPDVICYTVMITGLVVAGELEKAQTLFDEMIQKGQLPNEFTYNSMILGLCNAGKYVEARSMLEIMESRDCYPDFVVYRTLVRKLRNARKFPEVREVLNEMEKKGRYAHLVTKLKGYKR